jgi:dethiobiotin synthetase
VIDLSARTFFVTGTDTGVGKTRIASALLRLAASQGLRTAGLKPVAAGCEQINGQWVNADALMLQSAATEHLDYGQVNPVALLPAIAPHIAARDAGIRLSSSALIDHCRHIIESNLDLVVIEGAGGWLLPLNESETLADVCIGLKAPVILVVGVMLGCLNHALLTAGAIQNAGLTLTGWVANCIDPDMMALEENIESLKTRLPGTHLGTVPYCSDSDSMVDYLQLPERVEE